jgi:SAM-dependent methyltransferase
MTEPAIRFEDGALYEQTMGVWSRAAGAIFLDWLAPAPGLRWVDVGCGNGAFTELLMQRCAPAAVQGIDPSPQQLAFARGRPRAAGATFTERAAGTTFTERAAGATFTEGGAEALPLPDAAVDAATMALVIFFVPDPARGVAEMTRVTRPGGLVAAYAWDILGGGFPYRAIQAALRDRGFTPPMPPSVEASRLPALEALWRGAGLVEVETRSITAEREFATFDAFWANLTMQASAAAALATLPPADIAAIRDGIRARLPALPDGRIVYTARANAIRGCVPP